MRTPNKQGKGARILAFISGDGSIGLILLGSLLAVGWSLQGADWAETPSLPFVVALGFLTGFLLCRVRLPAPILLCAGIVVGLVTTLLLTSLLADSSGFVSRLQQTVERLMLWGSAAKGGGISADRLPFAFLLSTLAWLLAYVCAWLVFRFRSYWGAVIVSGAGLITNMSIADNTRMIEFGLFMLAALLLRVRMRTLEQQSERRWAVHDKGNRSGWRSMLDGTVLAAGVLAVSFVLPVGKDVRSFDGLYRVMHSPIEHFNGDFERLFAGLSGKVPSAFRSFGEQMALGGSVKLSDAAALIVESPSAVYLRAHTYDTYTSAGWKTGPSETHEQVWAPGTADSVRENIVSNPPVSISVKPLFPSGTVFVAGEVDSTDVPSQLESYSSPIYTINIWAGSSSGNAGLPQSIKDIEAEVQSAVLNLGMRRSPSINKDSLQKLMPADVVVLDITYQRIQPTQARIMRKQPSPADAVSLKVKGEATANPYKMQVSLSQATADELRSSGTDYPGWVRDRYLQLPGTLPARVKAFAEQVTEGAPTPYDKAKAIETYLRVVYPYSLVMDPPPYNRDAVDYFLFTARKGCCDYFSSAMAVTLRTVGVPARVVAGYAPGEREKDGRYLVRDRDAHSWPQAYFPGYGWIDFEPTPSRPVTAVEETAQQDEQADAVSSPTDVTGEEPPPDRTATPNISSWLSGGLRQVGRLWFLLLGGFLLAFLYAWKRLGSDPLDPGDAYRRLRLVGRMAGIPARPTATPYEYAGLIGGRWPEVRNDARRIADAYVRESYGGGAVTPADHTGASGGWRCIRSYLVRRLFLRRRTVSAIQ